jgi:hypothetical protein
MPDATLIELTKEVRWKTLKLLENVDDEQAMFAPPGTANTILWNAGHSLVVVDHLSFAVTKLGPPQVPADWGDKFTRKDPAAVTEWPQLSEIVAKLVDQRTRLLALIDTLTPQQLDKIVGEPPRNRTLRGMIVHGLHDEAGHQGEIHMLKKLWKLR